MRDAQAQATRRRIVAAAVGQFTDAGYAATSMRAIAATAAVSVPMIELVFGTKRQLLAAAIDLATAGDDVDTPMLERRDVTALDELHEPTPYLRAVCEVVASVQQRSGGVILAAREAARADGEVRAISAEIDQRRFQVAGWIAAGARRRLGRPTDDHHVTTTWLMIDPALHSQLVSRSRSDYPTWLFEALHDVLVGSGAPG